MKMWTLSLGLIVSVLCINGVTSRSAFMNMFPRHPTLHSRLHNLGFVSPPLYLTPILEQRNPGLARSRAVVNLTDQNKTTSSYAGYITVNQTTGSNMFFWLIAAKQNFAKAPLILWLQGGPGGSSLYGLFEENGPWSVDKKLKINLRKTSWSNMASVLYVDNPVGTGFSFTKNSSGYARTEDDVARDLWEFLQQFFYIFGELKDNDFYVTGESYAGKYVPALAYKIHLENQKGAKNHTRGADTPTFNITLAGMAIGDGLCDLRHMSDYATVLRSAGMIDEKEFDVMRGWQGKVYSFIHSEQWKQAMDLWDPILNCDKCGTASYFTNVTGSHNYFNYLRNDLPIDESYYPKFINQDIVRESIHVGDMPYNNGSLVEHYLWEDMPQSVRFQVAAFLNVTRAHPTRPLPYKVMFYTGQLDIIVNHLFTENFLTTLEEWRDVKDFNKSVKELFRLNGQVVAYTKVAKNLRYVMVRNAGHMVPKDQPQVAYEIMNRFIFDKKF